MYKPLRAFIVSLFLISCAWAVEFEGVQPAALDQPRVHLHLRRDPKGKALTAQEGKESAINIQAFLDTGASGVMLSEKTADALGVKRQAVNVKGKQDNATFEDVGVGGSDAFNISEKIHLFIAPWRASGEPDDQDGYPLSVGPLRTQVGPLNAGILEMLTGGLDVVGIPAIKGHIIILDPKPVDAFSDTMRAGIYDKRTTKLPDVDRHVKVSYGDFARFTRTSPGAESPALVANPFIGPNPAAAQKDATPAITATFKGKKMAGSWLFDTGAAASMISKANAAKLGVTYVEGTEGTDKPRLANIPEKDQFFITVGGIGGAKKAAGFFLDTLVLPTVEGDPIVYKGAPLLVSDISVEDPTTKQTITLDGVLGMNYFVASAFLEEGGLMPDVKHMTAGPYQIIIFDEPAATIGVKLKK